MRWGSGVNSPILLRLNRPTRPISRWPTELRQPVRQCRPPPGVRRWLPKIAIARPIPTVGGNWSPQPAPHYPPPTCCSHPTNGPAPPQPDHWRLTSRGESPQVGGGVGRWPPWRARRGVGVRAGFVFCSAGVEVGGDKVLGSEGSGTGYRLGGRIGGECAMGFCKPGGQFGIASRGHGRGSGQGCGVGGLAGRVTYPVGDNRAGLLGSVEGVGGVVPFLAGVEASGCCFGPRVGQGLVLVGVCLDLVGVGPR